MTSRSACWVQSGRCREAQFILCCLAAASSPEYVDPLIAMVDAGIDWETVMRAAPGHGVMQSLYRALVPALVSRLPPDAYERMRREVHGNAVRNFHLATEMVRLCGLLENHGVPALALKGPALAANAYGDIALRQFSDLDLLVRGADLDSALSVLIADGFYSKMPLKNVTVKSLSAWEVTLCRKGGLFAIDLHWRLSPSYFPFTPEGEELWDRAIEVNLGGGRVRTLCPEDLILFLCAHGAKHGWQALSGVCDVAQTISAHRFDWDRLVTRASSLGSLQILLLGLVLAHDLLGAVVPGHLIDVAHKNPAVMRGALMFCSYFSRLEVGGPQLLQRWTIPLGMISGRRARLRYAIFRAFLPASKDFDFVSLPAFLSSFYIAMRPLRFALQIATAKRT